VVESRSRAASPNLRSNVVRPSTELSRVSSLNAVDQSDLPLARVRPSTPDGGPSASRTPRAPLEALMSRAGRGLLREASDAVGRAPAPRCKSARRAVFGLSEKPENSPTPRKIAVQERARA